MKVNKTLLYLLLFIYLFIKCVQNNLLGETQKVENIPQWKATISFWFVIIK